MRPSPSSPRVPRRRPALPALLSVLLLLSSAAAVQGSPAPDSPPDGPAKEHEREKLQPLQPGDAAVDFDLPGVDGKRHRLADFAAAKALVVVFTCNHCPTAQLYEDRLIRLTKDYRPRGVAVVAISPNDPDSVRLDELGWSDLGDTLEEMRIRARQKRFPFPYLYDGESQRVSRAYGPIATPHAFVFDAERKLRYSGRIDDSESGRDIERHDLREALDAVLAGQKLQRATRVFGCSIKWADKRGSNREFLERLAKLPVTLEELDLDGAEALRKNAGEKLRLINLWATWCGPCVEELPDLVTTDRMYRHREFEMVTISLDEPEQKDAALRVLRKAQASNRNLIWSGGKKDALADAIDPKWSGAVPLTLLVAPGGEIVWRHEGRVDALALRRKIVSLLSPWK